MCRALQLSSRAKDDLCWGVGAGGGVFETARPVRSPCAHLPYLHRSVQHQDLPALFNLPLPNFSFSTPSTCVKSRQPCFTRTPARPLDRGADSTHLGDAHSWRSVMYTPVGRGSNGHFWRNLSGVYRKKTPTKENSVNLLVAPEGLLVFPTSFPHALLRDPPTEQLS